MTAVRWACVVAALGAGATLLLGPQSADLAAQQYRAGLVRDAGLHLWDNGWFAGHHTPAYSLLFGPLGALVGVGVAGALASIAAAALFARLAQRHWGARAGTVAALWFAVGVTATLVSGRLTFLLGVCAGTAAMLALQSARPALAAALAAVATLSSPVAGLFVALCVVAWGLASRRDAQRAWALIIAVAAVAPAAALTVLFAEGGTEPFVASAFWPALVATVLVALALPARERALRLGAALYAVLCAGAFIVASPLGGNVTRLGALLAGPVLAGALLSGPRPAARLSEPREPFPSLTARRVAAIALALWLALWQASPAVRDVLRASGDPSTAAEYHEPLVRYLESRPGHDGWRVEIPLTANHWEAAHVAPRIALARGWERQLDRRYGALFYDGSLDATSYRAWLDEHAVAYIALPDAELDYSAKAEARLIERDLPYLHQVWRNAHWRVFAVRHATPPVEGVASQLALTPDGFTITARRAGEGLVRVRHTRWWRVTAGRACVSRGPGAMTRVRVFAAGTVRVQAALSGSRCRR